jgi:hypothetical protein
LEDSIDRRQKSFVERLLLRMVWISTGIKVNGSSVCGATHFAEDDRWGECRPPFVAQNQQSCSEKWGVEVKLRIF